MGFEKMAWVWVSVVTTLALGGCFGPTSMEGLSGESGSETGVGESGAATATSADPAGTSSGDEGTASGSEDTGGPKLDVFDPDPPDPSFPETCDQAKDAFTSVGCTFFPLSLPGVTGMQKGFAVSNVSTDTATVTLSDIDGLVQEVQLDPGELHMFTVDDTHTLPFATQVGDNGYIIESDQVLQAYQFSPAQSAATADASIVLPASSLGTRHRAVTYNDGGLFTPRSVAIVATQDNTEVTFELAKPFSETHAGGPVPALDMDDGPTSHTLTLDALQTLIVYATGEDTDTGFAINDLSGSLVTSDKPIAVYSGNPVTYLPFDLINSPPCCADQVFTAVPPTAVYGTEYAGVKLLPLGQEEDVWRFIGDLDDTIIELSGGFADTIVLHAGESVDVQTGGSFYAVGTKPFGLVHMMSAGGAVPTPGLPYSLEPHDCPDPIANPGDPAITWVFPRGNWLHRYVFPVGPTTGAPWCHDHATIVAPLDAWDTITLDAEALPAPLALGTSGLGYTYAPLSGERSEVVAPPDVRVEVTVSGYVNHGSYLYPGGMALTTLNPAD